MNLKGILPLIILGGFVWTLSKIVTVTPAIVETGRPPENDLPGYVFPEPGQVGEVINAEGQVVAYDFITGTAEQAYENAQDIRVAHPVPTLIRSYNDVRTLDTNVFKIPAGLGGEMVPADRYNPVSGEYLDISPHGWVVYKKDFSTLDPLGWANKRGEAYGFAGLNKELLKW